VKTNLIYSTPPAARMLVRLRKICERLQDASETVSWGHPTFKVSGKTFAVFEQYKGDFSLALEAEKEVQDLFLKDPRFYLTPYLGKQGWITLRMTGEGLDWREVRELVKGSHRLITQGSKKKASRKEID